MSRYRDGLYQYPGLESNIASLVRQNPGIVRPEFGPYVRELIAI